MNGSWREYKFRENARVTERYRNLVVYYYYDSGFGEKRYAVVLEDAILVNSREYPGIEIDRIANVYSSILRRRNAG